MRFLTSAFYQARSHAHAEVRKRKQQTQVSLIRTVSFIPKCVLLFMARFSVSLKTCTHRFTSHKPSCASCSWLWECANGALNSQNYPLRILFITDQAWSIKSNGAQQSKRLWNSQLPVAECFQSPSMLCPKPLQCLSPTLQPQSYQNSSHQFLFATPVRRTKRKAHLCSTNTRAHLLFAWTIVAATVEQFIHG